MTQNTAYQISPPSSAPDTRPHSRGWTPERRLKAAARIRKNKPWLKTTGPKTDAGKAVSKMNALKHGQRSQAEIEKHREVIHFLREQKVFLQQVRLMLRIRRQSAKLKKPTNEMMKRHPRPVTRLPFSGYSTAQGSFLSFFKAFSVRISFVNENNELNDKNTDIAPNFAIKVRSYEVFDAPAMGQAVHHEIIFEQDGKTLLSFNGNPWKRETGQLNFPGYGDNNTLRVSTQSGRTLADDVVDHKFPVVSEQVLYAGTDLEKFIELLGRATEASAFINA